MQIENYLRETLLFSVVRQGSRISEHLSERFAPAQVNYVQALILIAISREKGDIRPRDLREAFGLSSGAISQAVTRLERLKYLERRISPTDARGYHLRLTRLGRSQADWLVNVVESLERGVERALGPAKARVCVSALGDLLRP